MFQIAETEEFSQWLQSIKDVKTKTQLMKRLRKASLGNLCEVRWRV
jgi:putative component of toxin-antitoxin plasmid stabilization module